MLITPSAWNEAANRLNLSGFVLDLNRGELLTHQDQLAGLRKQALDVLLVLGARAGQVVTKDELMSRVWPDVVVGEGSLVQAIADIRRVLGDTGHRVIRNVARRGYMLVPEDPVVPPAAAADAIPAQPLASENAAPVAQRTRHRWLVPAAILSTVGIVGASVMFSRSDLRVENTPAALKTPLARDIPLASLVMLPFAVEGASGDGAWSADALLIDLTNEVARIPGIRVVANATASTYKGMAVDPRQLARELRVRYVVRGSLRHQSDVILLSLEMIDGETGLQRWGEQYVVERARINEVRDEFVVKVGRLLHIEVIMAAGDRVATLPPDEVSADDLNMQGFSLLHRSYSSQNLHEARALFERAIVKNPNSIRAWGGVSIANYLGVSYGWLPDRSAAMRRLDLASDNLERLDPNGYFAYQAKICQALLRKDWPAALRVSEVLAARHHNPVSYAVYGHTLALNGRPAEAVAPLELALRLSPRDALRAEWQYRLALAHFMLNQYEQARDWSQTAQISNPNLAWPPIHAAALVRLGNKAEGKRVLDDFLLRHPKYEINDDIGQQLGGTGPHVVESRERLVASLREIGMR
ncbi:MAG: winged helix-turn-helix domain-containing protein [Burkholderiaceae bacterium]|nr:winged helix-turn-helix domain-containing protein [Burkholderiaceae bacterium]